MKLYNYFHTPMNDKKDRIYQAAIEVFAHHGFENTTVDEIAQKAKIAKGTIYYHFKSKDDIFLGIIQQGIKKFSDLLSKTVKKSSDPVEQLSHIIICSYDFFEKYQKFMRVLLTEFWRFKSHWKQDTNKLQDPYVSIIAGVIKKGKEQGVFKMSLNEDAIAITLFGFISTATLEWSLFRPKETKEHMLHTIQEILLKGVLK